MRGKCERKINWVTVANVPQLPAPHNTFGILQHIKSTKLIIEMAVTMEMAGCTRYGHKKVVRCINNVSVEVVHLRGEHSEDKCFLPCYVTDKGKS